MGILAQELGIAQHHASLVDNESLVGAANGAAGAKAGDRAAVRSVFHCPDGDHSHAPAGADNRKI